MQNRREFLKKMAIGSVALSTTPSVFSETNGKMVKGVKKSVSSNSLIQIALIGKGGMGTLNVSTALSVEGVKLVAVCDLYDKRLKDAKAEWGNDLFITKEYKEILSRKDVDAVIIATPDHWHQPIAIEAMKAGKHVYCEKPVIHKLNEAKALIEAYNKCGVLFQVGSQGMASLGNRAARLLIKQGIIGPVNFIDGQFTSAPGRLNSFVAPEDATEETIWWDRFLGNAPKKPFNPQHFFAWRNWRDYGTGLAGDLYVHVLSSVHYIMDAIGPEKVYTTGGHYDHHFNFINGIRDNAPLTADVLFAVRSAAPALLSYESYLRNEAIQWDAKKMKIKK